MTEHDVRDGLYAAVSDEPPLHLDPDALVATARRQSRRRLALVAVGSTTVAVAVAAVSVPIALGIASGPFVPSADQPVTSAAAQASDTAWPPASTVARHYRGAELEQRGEQMRTHLTATLREVFPKATKFAVPRFQGAVAGPIPDGQDYLNTFATFTLAGQRSGLSVAVHAPGASVAGPDEMCGERPEGTRCQSYGRRGDGVVVVRTVDAGAGQLVTVCHFRDDGSVVSAAGYDYDPTSHSKRRLVPALPPTATVDQLIRVATDSQLGI